LYFREESNIRNGEQRRSKRKTVMICDDERDILKMFAIELPRKYNVLTAQSGEECIKMYLDAKHSGSKIEATFGLQARRYYW
jgi:response regulator RpfG family c-di-GMP phosphodiesterase